MCYRIEYGPEIRSKPSNRRTFFRIPVLTAVFFFLFLLSVRIWWDDGSKLLRQWMIPAEFSATEEAFSSMVENLRSGAELKDAVTTFCQELLSDAKLG